MNNFARFTKKPCRYCLKHVFPLPTSSSFLRKCFLPPHSQVYAGIRVSKRLNHTAQNILIAPPQTWQNGISDKMQMVDNVSVEKNLISIYWKDNHHSYFHYSFLRSSCDCDKCVHSTSQRIVTPAHLPLGLEVCDIKETENEISILWNPDGHTSTYSKKWLRENCYASASLLETSRQVTPQFLTEHSRIPEIQYAEVIEESQEGLLNMLHHIITSGICILKNVPLIDQQVRRIAERIAPISHSYLYGDTFDVVSKTEPENIAYSSEALGLHSDLAYYESPPGLQLLHAIRVDNSIKGGASLFMDAFYAADVLRKEYPEEFKVLSRVPATFKKRHLKREKPVIIEYQRPHITLNHLHEVNGVFWSPPFEGVLRVPFEDVEPYYHAYRVFHDIVEGRNEFPKRILKYELKNGDLVIFNNRRILHGRSKFERTDKDSVRHLQGTYVNIDDALCKYNVLREGLNVGIIAATRVGNQNYT